jgi:hypothetical protein
MAWNSLYSENRRNKMTAWTTKNELYFLKNIGTYNKGKDPKKCLEGYIKGAELRDDWGKIDKKVVIKTAKAMLGSMS